jgi:hypothetical protein
LSCPARVLRQIGEKRHAILLHSPKSVTLQVICRETIVVAMHNPVLLRLRVKKVFLSQAPKLRLRSVHVDKQK